MTITKKIHTITLGDDVMEAITDTIWELDNNYFLDEEEIKKVLEE